MKKLISYLSALAMAVSLIPASLASAETAAVEPQNGYYVLEAEDGKYTDYVVSETSAAFGGKLLKNFGNGDNPSVEWTINSQKDDTYDIWVLRLDARYVGGEMNAMGVSVNGGELKDLGHGNNYPEKMWRYSAYIDHGKTGELAWRKMSNVEIPAGDINIKFGVYSKGANNLSAIDRIMIVPSNWKWEPAAEAADYLTADVPYDTTIIKADSTGSIIMEAEVGETENANVITSSNAFGGKYVANFNWYSDAPYISWNVEIPDDRAYDVWALTLCNPAPGNTAAEMNLMQMFYGENAAKTVARANVSYIRYPASELGLSAQKLCWTKVYSKEVFGKGSKQFVYNMESKGGNNLFALDRVVIVPSENLWRPSDKDYAGSTEYLTDDIPCVMDAPFTPDNDNVVWMEAEKADMEGFSVCDNENASGGKDIKLQIQGGTSNDAVYNVDFLFDVDKEQAYDVWVLAKNDPGQDWYSHYETSLDGEEYKTYTNGITYGGYVVTDFPEMYNFAILGSGSTPARWTKVNVGEALSEGRHKFTMKFPQRQMGDGYYIAQVDTVAVVPSSLNWVPDSVNKPQKRENGYAWIEMENPDNGTLFQKVLASSTLNADYYFDASNSSYIRANADEDYSNTIKGNQKLDYSFTLANSGEYDIYFLGSDLKADHLSKLYYDIDSSSDSVADDAHKAVPSWKSTTVMRAITGDTIAQDYWQKIGSGVEIAAGDHVLNMEWAERSGEAPNGEIYSGHYMQADALVIVPTEWEFAMPDETATNAAVTAMDLDGLEKVIALNNAYAGGVRSDLEGLDTYGSAGSTFTYSSRSDNLAADGTVTRPAIGESPAEAELEIFAHKVPSVSNDAGYKYNVDSDSSVVVSFKIMPLDAVEFNNFNAAYADGTQIDALTSGAKVNASVQIKKLDDTQRSAIIAAAVYKGGVLISVQSSSTVLSDEYQSLETTITLPTAEDMSGYSLKVFLWDSLSSANPYTGALEY